MEKRKQIYRILQWLFLVALVIILLVMGLKLYQDYRAKKLYEDLQQASTQGVDDQSELEISGDLDVEIPKKSIDWEELKSVNEDIYAWIYVPGTDVDFPVLQHPEELSYYLTHAADGEKSEDGAIYSQFLNKTDFTDPNTILYGHTPYNRDGMFSSLHNFESLQFFETYRYIFIYMPDKVLVYEVFAAYTGTNDHILFAYDFSVKSSYEKYLSDIFEIRDMNAHFLESVTLTTENHLLTLSTCLEGAPDDKRYLVQGVLLNEKELK